MLIQNAAVMLAMFRVIEVAKCAVEDFEKGELNVREAVRLIQDAAADCRAL
jgi:hypothetical protein